MLDVSATASQSETKVKTEKTDVTTGEGTS